VDTAKVGIHVFDVSGVAQASAEYVTFIPTRQDRQDLNGNTTPTPATTRSACRLDHDEHRRQVHVPLDRRDHQRRDTQGDRQLRPNMLDASGHLVPAPYTHSRFMLEVDFTMQGK